MTNKPGFYKGRHYTTYIEEVKVLKRDKQLECLEELLSALVQATEEEARAERHGVPSWYHEQLAILYHQQGKYTAELAVLRRALKHGGNQEFVVRLEKVRRLLEGETSLSQIVNEAETYILEQFASWERHHESHMGK